MTAYFDELAKSMHWLAQQPGTIFMGQAVACPGTAMSRTLQHIKPELLLELPVAEDMQMGMAIGMSLAGFIPVCIYPRFNFLLLAMNQLVLHLDKLPLYSEYRPKVIIRTAVATDDPMDPGPQHLGDFTIPMQSMLRTVKVEKITEAEQVLPAYAAAFQRPESTLLIEMAGMY